MEENAIVDCNLNSQRVVQWLYQIPNVQFFALEIRQSTVAQETVSISTAFLLQQRLEFPEKKERKDLWFEIRDCGINMLEGAADKWTRFGLVL